MGRGGWAARERVVGGVLAGEAGGRGSSPGFATVRPGASPLHSLGLRFCLLN